MPTTTHTEQALVTLRQRILGGDYPGGARLYEVALAEDLEISRTPIRAALSKLAEEGLLDRQRGGGFAVRRFDLADVIDTIELRGVLEGTAARLAAERGAPAGVLAEMDDIARRIDAALGPGGPDMERYAEGNSLFHRALARASGSRVLGRELDRVTALPFASPSAFLEDDDQAGGLRDSLIGAQAQHRALIEAIRARQGTRAEFLAREHARAAHRNAVALTSAARAATPLAIVSG